MSCCWFENKIQDFIISHFGDAAIAVQTCCCYSLLLPIACCYCHTRQWGNETLGEKSKIKCMKTRILWQINLTINCVFSKLRSALHPLSVSCLFTCLKANEKKTHDRKSVCCMLPTIEAWFESIAARETTIETIVHETNDVHDFLVSKSHRAFACERIKSNW